MAKRGRMTKKRAFDFKNAALWSGLSLLAAALLPFLGTHQVPVSFALAGAAAFMLPREYRRPWTTFAGAAFIAAAIDLGAAFYTTLGEGSGVLARGVVNAGILAELAGAITFSAAFTSKFPKVAFMIASGALAARLVLGFMGQARGSAIANEYGHLALFAGFAIASFDILSSRIATSRAET